MRVAFLGVSHWHTALYLDPVLALAQEGTVRPVGIADPDPAVVAAYRARLGCDGDTDYRALCARTKPDFVFALGRHCDMAQKGEFLIAQGIACALEKPCGLNGGEVARLAARAEATGAFVAVPLVLRNGGFLPYASALIAREGVTHASFRFIAGPAKRYVENGCSWMLDPAQSGGGCTANLAVHFFDIAATWFADRDPRVVSAVMSNAAWVLPVEDYCAVTLVAGAATCVIESGYLYPAPTHVFDMHYGVKTGAHYITAWDPSGIEVRDEQGHREDLVMPTTNVPLYGTFVADVLQRAAEGRSPLASLRDMANAFRLIDAAYALAEPFKVARPA